MVELKMVINSRKNNFKKLIDFWLELDCEVVFHSSYGFKNTSSYRGLLMPQTIEKLKIMGCKISTYKYVESHQTTQGATIDWSDTKLSIENMRMKHMEETI
jgi:hypothetical protein